MSTTSSGLLAPAAIISENLIRPYFGKNLKDSHFLWILRANVLLVAAIALGMASWKSDIYELVAGASILMLVSLFVPLTAGLYWKKASAVGAFLALFVGMGAYLAAEMVLPNQETHLIGLFASGLAMVLGSFIFPTKIPTTHDLS